MNSGGLSMPARSKYARRRLLGVSTLLAAVLAASVMPVGAADAAVSGSNVKPAAGNSAPAGGSAAAQSKHGALPSKPTAPPKAKPVATMSADAARKARAAAAAHAIATSTVPNTCSGAIQPDTIYPCTGSAGPDTFTADLTGTTDVLLVEAMATNGGAGVSVTGPDGNPVTCQQGYGPVQCPTTAAGTYTIQVANSGSDFTLDYRALLSDTSCATADTSFAAPTIQGNLADGSVGDCYLLNLPSGAVLDHQVTGEFLDFFDATGAQVCPIGGGEVCTLTGTGPYRANVSGYYSATASAYQLRLNSVSNPQGCEALAQQVYGQVPDTSSLIRCRTLTVATAGLYQIYPAGASTTVASTLYQLDGSVACTNNFGPDCDLAAGTYSFVLNEDISATPQPFGVVFIAGSESRGCIATGDTDFATGPVTGTFSGLGEEICLTLPTASGLSDYVLNEFTATGFPPMQVLDATGAQQCSDQYYTYHVCALSGTAPFRMVLLDGAAGAAYREVVQRTDSTAGCTAWPQSGFGGSWGVQTSLDPSIWGRCFTIPANAHSTGEMIDYANTANNVNAGVTVNDPTGKQVCLGNSLAFCSYQAGVAYTALLQSSSGVTDTYELVRRDVSSTAPCGAPASTTVGAPSTSLMLTSDLDAACFRVAAAATDRWWMDVRAVAPDKAGAVLVVTDPTGKIVCRQWGISCNVTGSAGYQVVVIASGYTDVPIPAHVDVWKVGTASGWSSQCTAHPLSVTGFPVQNGTLTETSTAYCAVVPVQPSQGFGIYGSDTATGVNTVWISSYLPSDWTNGIGLCQGVNYGSFGFTCSTQSNDPAGDAVFIVTPGGAPTPVSYTMQGVACRIVCNGIPTVQATISSVSPAQGAVGVDRITITGTGLTLGTRVNLASNYSVVSNGDRPVSVSPDGTSLTVDLYTYGVTPGKYDMVLDYSTYTVGTPSPGYLPNAFTVTAAPPPAPAGLLMPLTPTRVLDTRHGVGAPQARVAAGGVLKLQVDGVARIPASGVTAVVLNVTVVSPASGGYLTVYPDGVARPTASNLDFSAGETIPNLVVVPVVDGKVDFYNGSGGALDLVADATGYYASTGAAYHAVGPTRAMDTRTGLGGAGGVVAPGAAAVLPIMGSLGISPGNVTAVVLNVTAVSPASGGYLTVYPDGVARPTASNLDFSAGETIPNLVVVPVVNGNVVFYNGSGGNVQIIADVEGYFAS